MLMYFGCTIVVLISESKFDIHIDVDIDIFMHMHICIPKTYQPMLLQASGLSRIYGKAKRLDRRQAGFKKSFKALRRSDQIINLGCEQS